jgi:hypothetical protein
LSLSVQYRTDCAIQAKYATVKDIVGLESAVDDWQISRLSGRSMNRTEDMEWPLTVRINHVHIYMHILYSRLAFSLMDRLVQHIDTQHPQQAQYHLHFLQKKVPQPLASATGAHQLL